MKEVRNLYRILKMLKEMFTVNNGYGTLPKKEAFANVEL